MSPEQFVQAIEDYYGQYLQAQKRVVKAWAEKRSAAYLEVLISVLIRTYSTQYKTAPGIVEFGQVADEVMDTIDRRFAIEQTRMMIEENRRLLAEPGPKMIDVNGEQINAGEYFWSVVNEAAAHGRNPRKDPEVIRAYELITGEPLIDEQDASNDKP